MNHIKQGVNYIKAIAGIFLFLVITYSQLQAQSTFGYSLEVRPVTILNLPGIHSHAFAQHNGRWLVIGGRLDGVHARQPFNAFPQSQNNMSILVIDPVALQYWSMSVDSFSVPIREQLQSTNTAFYQDADTLYIVGGYAFSQTANDHITFSSLLSVNVSGLMNAVVNTVSPVSFVKQITDSAFAVTGGQLGKIGNTFYLVGGHRFNGRYNPMGNPTYIQIYTNQIRKFTLVNTAALPVFSNYSVITDPVHLHRRDYNLVPQSFPDRTEGYMLSSGVFQTNVNLPYLYPVNISAAGYQPVTAFNQYLSNYHSAKASLYDSLNNEMHTLFFGGMSQYYYQNQILIQDNQVPFVKTISRVTRLADSSLTEYVLPVEMPVYTGAGAEFIPNNQLPHYPFEVIKLSSITNDSILIGHIYGGIYSSALNPFSSNQTSLTSASATIYEVWLYRSPVGISSPVNGENPYTMNVFPNPAKSDITISFSTNKEVKAYYFMTLSNGKIVGQGEIPCTQSGVQLYTLQLPAAVNNQSIQLTVVIDNKFYMSEDVIIHR
ncbi:MAG: hypothetical protein ACK5Z2_12595 [Bacteroidota bacterium]